MCPIIFCWSFLQGYLDRSPVFYGFYTRGSLDFKCLNTPLLYFAGILTILTFSLIMVVRRLVMHNDAAQEVEQVFYLPLFTCHRTTVGYKHTWMLGKRYSMNVSYKIFCGWDFTIRDPAAASLKHSFIRNDLKVKGQTLRTSVHGATYARSKICQTAGKIKLYFHISKLNTPPAPPTCFCSSSWRSRVSLCGQLRGLLERRSVSTCSD